MTEYCQFNMIKNKIFIGINTVISEYLNYWLIVTLENLASYFLTYDNVF